MISLLGPRKPYRAQDVPVFIDRCRAIVAAMTEHQIRRLIALSTPSRRDPADRKEFLLGLGITISRKFGPVVTKRSCGQGADAARGAVDAC